MVQDRRINKTKKVIEDAFLELLEYRPLAKIKVTDIANKANIARKTFYAHYHDLEDLTLQLYQKSIKGYQKILYSVTSLQEKPTLKQVVGLVNFVDHNKHLIKALNTVSEQRMNKQVYADNGHVVQSRLTECLPEFDWDTTKVATVLCNFLTTGTNEIIKAWVEDPSFMNKKQLIYLLYQFTVRPFDHFSDPQKTNQAISEELAKPEYSSWQYFI
ncbi:TetR/AcrR family transcriptional regulator [Lactobacillus sp. ESL0684]|uniref:TetR/AcrR family transcriptional regulator n=1 Tax=Lactobacillus sp. ESL0684 TaxID=2983213 RepID=UPI0023F8A538|nr:TetR/AcrR family transcriptional regulator [Lactobacillus sp. ESL0684]WEV43837.1 TetR/AcrR family transcriptional regulator [Lactobacillus sp. ESL0684]